MCKMVGEIIGIDDIVKLEKDNGILVFNKWESGDYDYQQGNPVENTNRLRTPVAWKKHLKPNVKYKITASSNMVFALRVYKEDGSFIGSYSNTNSGTNTREFTINTSSTKIYGLMMINTIDKNTVVKIEEVK